MVPRSFSGHLVKYLVEVDHAEVALAARRVPVGEQRGRG
jgi:hypothetical protein